MELRNRLSVAVATAIGRSKRTRFDTHPCRLEHDPDAYWDPSTKTIKNGCVETLSCYRYVNGSTTVADPNATVSPRVVPLPVFDPQLQFQTGQIRMVNILGFFLEPMQDKDLRGILVNNQGCSLAGAEASRHQRRSRP